MLNLAKVSSDETCLCCVERQSKLQTLDLNQTDPQSSCLLSCHTAKRLVAPTCIWRWRWSVIRALNSWESVTMGRVANTSELSSTGEFGPQKTDEKAWKTVTLFVSVP